MSSYYQLRQTNLHKKEVKGFETQLWRIKKRLLVALLPEINPNAEYIVVK